MLLGHPPMLDLWNKNRRDFLEFIDNIARVFEPPQLGVARRKEAVARGPARILL